MTLKFYLDKRHRTVNGEFPLKLVISHKGKAALYPLGINLAENQFNENKERIESHPNKVFLNNHISRRRIDVQEVILQLKSDGKLNTMSATEVKNYVKAKLEDTEDNKLLFTDILHKVADECNTISTKSGYLSVEKLLKTFCPSYAEFSFEHITFVFLDDFCKWLKTKGFNPNTIHLYISKIKSVFIYAINRELTTCFPFRKLKIKRVPTLKRSLSIDQLRTIFDMKNKKEEMWIDVFKLIFCLIGINSADLFDLKGINNVGRVEYARHKTNREYSIKVEPETEEIINKYNSNFHFSCTSPANFKHSLNYHLHNIGKKIGIPELTSYYARHTWATIAAELDIPRDTIAHALGHGSNTVTDVYINFNYKKVDDANRKVLDYVSGNNQKS